MNASTNKGAPVAQDLTEFYILTALRALNEFEGFPWLLELWPGRVDSIDTQDDVLGWL